MNQSFTAIDFETAHGKRWSICAVGLVRVEDGTIKEKLSLMVRPPDNIYSRYNIDIHGITPRKTANAPTFAGVWPQIEPFITNQNVVAHSGFKFDFNVLKQTLEYYEIVEPKYTKHCTCKIYGKDLATLCREHRIPLNHHEALSDALACAELFNRHLATK